MSAAFSHMRKVLVVTKRRADMCAAKELLNGFGYDVATATNLEAAAAVGRSVRLDAAVVCRHSFDDAERDSITAALKTNCPELRIVYLCPGCTGCDENAGIIGRFTCERPLGPVADALESGDKS
ncbi:MAG: hypothetical protein ACE14L_08265 [Terriglobales bacterium]